MIEVIAFRLLCVAAVLSLAAPVRATGQPAGRSGRTTAGTARPARPAKTARAKRAPPGPVTLYTVNTKETMLLKPGDVRGKQARTTQKRLQRLLRCHYTGAQHRMHPRILSLLYQTGRHFPSHRVEVVSGFRHPKFAKNPKSPHKNGLACDFRVAGVKNADLRDYLRKSFGKVGIGYYPNSSFVHLDVRKGASAFWIDYSVPGERAMYSSDAAADLKSGRAEAWKPAKIDGSWASAPEDMKNEDPDEKGSEGGGVQDDKAAAAIAGPRAH